MTTKPKAKKFRIRRSTSLTSDLRRVAPEQTTRPAEQPAGPAQQPARPAGQPEPPAPDFSGPTDDGFGTTPYPTAAAQELTPSDEVNAETEIAAIRREGLTGRQLRMARRVAQKHGLAPTSDFDAVRLLRKQGIDPFQRSNMLELVVPGAGEVKEKGLDVPQTVPKPQLPSTEVYSEDARAREIIRMQRDIVKRRRRRLIQLFSRLAFFVLLPTLLAGYYYHVIATPMYATKSEFVIQQAESPMSAASGLGGLFSGTSFATSQDSIAVQGYLQSLDAMLRLDTDLGFRGHFSNPGIDALQRLDADATKEQAYKVYKKRVKISYDPTEGIIKMEVVAADPVLSQRFSERLIFYAEEQVDNLTQRLRADQMQGARDSFEEAEQKMVDAQQRVLALQEKLGVLDPLTESNALMTQITGLETQLQEKRLQLQQLLDNARPNRARVEGARGDVRRLENLIAELRAQLTETTAEGQSLARITGELRLAERDLQTRELMMTQALQQMETARIEANRQTRYLSLAVNPIAPDEATYPRAFENTVLAFLIFGGIYLMISLTGSILREQVSG
ncbi:MAG: capsule biosynthesis protein [Rhodobacter sp.]|nr:capsule biosynthesis protein [Rhodobacter sp.]